MTAFKPGDRVHVEYEDVLRGMGPGMVWFDGARSAHPDDCTLVRAPLRVGDVLTADDPEPPKGTVVRTKWGAVYARSDDAVGDWVMAGLEDSFAWRTLAGAVPTGADVNGMTVLYVPEGAS